MYKRQELCCSYVIGADGVHSLVRTLEGIGFDFYKQYQDTWLVLDTLNKRKVPLDNKVVFHCGEGKPCPSIPSPGNRHRFEFRLDSQKREPTIDEENFRVERKANYQFKAGSAKQFQNRGVFLVGDSAHVTPPLLVKVLF